MRYLKNKLIAKIDNSVPVTVTSSLMLSSNINWGHIGFLLI